MIKRQNLHLITPKKLSIFLDFHIDRETKITDSDVKEIMSDVYKVISPEGENHCLFDHRSLDKDLPRDVYKNINRWMEKLWDANLADHFSDEISLGSGYTKILTTLYKYYMFKHDTSSEEFKIPVVFPYPEISLHHWLYQAFLRFHIETHHERDSLIITQYPSTVKHICSYFWETMGLYEETNTFARIYFKLKGKLHSTRITRACTITMSKELEEYLPEYAQELYSCSDMI